jgi:hypothetical protein
MSFKLRDLYTPYYYIRVDLSTLLNTVLYYTKSTNPENNSVNDEKETPYWDVDEAELFTSLDDAVAVAKRIKLEWSCGRIFIYQHDIHGNYGYVVKTVE